MLKLDFTKSEIDQIYREFMEHPSGPVKKKSHVICLKALGLPHQEIVCIARVGGDSVTRYLKAYAEGGFGCALQIAALLPWQCVAAALGSTQHAFSSPSATYHCASRT